MENEVRRHFDEKIKYGEGYMHHLDERIPHFHGKGKKNTELTKEIGFRELRVWQKGKDLAVYIYQIPIKIFKHKNKLNFGGKNGNKSKSEI